MSCRSVNKKPHLNLLFPWGILELVNPGIETRNSDKLLQVFARSFARSINLFLYPNKLVWAMKTKLYNQSIQMRAAMLWTSVYFEGREFKGTSSLSIPCCAFLSVVEPRQIVFTLLKDISPLEVWEWMENSFLQQRLVNHSTFILPRWPLPSQANNGTHVYCRWVGLKARLYILATSILQLQKLSEIK